MFCGLLAALIAAAPASASDCPGNPGALGTSRTIVVDPAEHALLGGVQYRESLPLNDKEVVITFDDGPLPPYSARVLDILAHECVKATFFMVGRMARTFPQVVRRASDEGHTIANHSQNHPFNFHRMTVEHAAREIEDGFQSLAAAVGDPAKVAPFFRFPGLLRQDAVEQYLRSRRVMAWSVDFMADDWTRINSHEVVRRALERLEAKGKGILLLHDIKPATALGLPDLLRELKERGYRVVHVVPATTGRPATVTGAEQWLAPGREHQRDVNVWPRVLPHPARAAVATMRAPSVTSFGAETPNDPVPVALVSTPDTLRGRDAEVALPPWPEEVITLGAFPELKILPAPSAENFHYNRMARGRTGRGRSRPKQEITHSVNTDITGSISSSGNSQRESKSELKSGKTSKSGKSSKPHHASRARMEIDDPIGHQIQLTQP